MNSEAKKALRRLEETWGIALLLVELGSIADEQGFNGDLGVELEDIASLVREGHYERSEA